MSTVTNNNKRIAKNTILLYIRMLFTMIVSFFTSRVVLQTLGISDYGVYALMGSVIGMLGYVNTLLAGGTSRFLTIGLGENNPAKLKLTFSTTIVLTLFTSILVIILGETVGFYFFYNYLNIDPSRMEAAQWVYQCALLSSVLTIMNSPFTASIISHEKMDIYAYMSILDVVMKLLIVYVLMILDYDKLIIYSILMFSVNLLNFLILRTYCIRNFAECAFSLRFDRGTFKKMFAYSGWNMFGSLSALLMDQGVSIVINIFFGTIINAAKGVANQVNNVIRQLYSNFQLAARPQIMKYYAQGKCTEMFELMINTSRYCAFLLICIIVPVIVNVEGLLNIWLVETPEYSVDFIRLTLLYTLFRAIDEPLTAGIHAVGKMKLPNLTTAIINMMVFPITWLVCKLGGSPITANIIFVIDAPVILLIDLLMLRKFINFPMRKFINESVIPVALFFSLSLLLPIITLLIFPKNTLFTIINSIFSFIYTMLIIYIFALPKNVRIIVKRSFIDRASKIIKNH